MAVCLFLVHYAKYDYVFISILRWYLDKEAFARVISSEFFELSLHTWWSFVHLVGYGLIPLIFGMSYLKLSIKEMGLGWGATSRNAWQYGVLAAPIVLFAWFASTRADFQALYPFYSFAGRSAFDFLAWECLYIIQFIALEFFFRGFLLQGSHYALGRWPAIFVMVIPYLMIHFQKPWLEAFGALPFGLLLGWLALHSRSIWGGVFVHVCIAISMDVFALIRS